MCDPLEKIRELADEDREDLEQQIPGVAEIMKAAKEGHDVEGMLEDFEIDIDELEDYLDNT